MQSVADKTIEVYGITNQELHNRIGKAMIEAEYNTRIATLKENLARLRDEGQLLSHKAQRVNKYIDFWRDFLDNL